MNVLEDARRKHRKMIESMYDCTCTIIGGKEKVKDPITKETKLVPKIKYKDILCRISKQSLSKNTQTDTVNEVVYELKLFICPEIEIQQGDEIEINQFNIITKYKAGEPFKYTSHQEVILKREDKA